MLLILLYNKVLIICFNFEYVRLLNSLRVRGEGRVILRSRLLPLITHPSQVNHTPLASRGEERIQSEGVQLEESATDEVCQQG